jgi:UDP-N-acetylmuramyl pentapeptide phosphotransferase/UDP-N-acetylglucosamine-1-phosphate transferase
MNWLLLAGLFVSSAVVAGLATARLIPILRRKLVDHPNERSSHVVPTPRGAGLVLIPIVALLWGAIGFSWIGPADYALIQAAGAAAALCGLSWLDDLRGLSPLVRLCAHILVVAALVYAVPSDVLYTQGYLPVWVDRIFIGIVWVWFINLFNFMDGIDGISGVETAMICLGIVVLASLALPIEPLALPAAILTGAALGFLALNWHPAKIFLGDSGSVPLGLLLGWLLLQLAGAGYWAAAIILPLYYFADATITITRRLLRGEKIWQAHRQHAYQRAVAGGSSHAQVSLLIALANVLLIVLAVVSVAHPAFALAGAIVVTGGLLALLERRAVRP